MDMLIGGTWQPAASGLAEAPAMAAGNAVVLKPARTTPLTALSLARCCTDAGMPAGVLSAVTGPGAKLGDALVTDPRVRKVSFTGSTATGQHGVAGIKKLSLELGSSCPVVVLPDADIELAAAAVAAGGFIRGAVAAGAKLLTGGERDGAVLSPAVVAGVDPESPFSQDELFGPAMAVSSAEDWESAIAQANGTPFGLGAGTVTSDVSGAVRAIREIDAGTVHINWTPLRRADLMPYGGLKASGIGKEGPRSAVAEMTEVKTVILHGRPW